LQAVFSVEKAFSVSGRDQRAALSMEMKEKVELRGNCLMGGICQIHG
jgi:hypothetical protein